MNKRRSHIYTAAKLEDSCDGLEDWKKTNRCPRHGVCRTTFKSAHPVIVFSASSDVPDVLDLQQNVGKCAILISRCTIRY